MTLAHPLPNFRLDGKRAIITGAGRGIAPPPPACSHKRARM